MANKKMKIGIVGCGTIGTQLAKAIEARFLEQAELLAICDTDQAKARKLKANSAFNPAILPLDELSGICDLIIEAASCAISFAVAQSALNNGKDVMIMSVGGILGQAKQLFRLAKTKGAHIYLPSGAIAGLDAIKAAALAKIEKVTLTTRKPPQGLAGAPYLSEKRIDLTKIRQETLVFEGNAQEAIKGFPQNVNICATLSLTGIGPEKTRVRIISSPDYKANIHELEVEGDFGKLYTRSENVPAPNNPKTSFLAALSAIATLENILSVVKIGT